MRGWLLIWLLVAVSATAVERVSPEGLTALKAAKEQLDANHPASALKLLEAIRAKAKSGAEQALIAAYSAYAYLALGRAFEAAEAAQTALEAVSLPEALRPELLIVLGQAQLQRARFQEAAVAFEQALAAGKAAPEVYYLAAYARYRLRQFERAIAWLNQALAGSKQPDEWYQLLLACYVESRKFQEATQTLAKLVERDPDNHDLWQQWLALALAAKNPQQALAATVLAWHAGKLAPDRFLDLARLYAAAGLPEKAARLIAAWRKQGILPETLDALRLEADLWLLARERQAALPVLEQIAHKSGQGSDWLAAMRVAAELEAWPKTVQLAQRALASKLANPAEAELWLGIAAYHLQDTQTAEAALSRVQDSRRLGSYARHWLGCLNTRRQRPCR